MVSKIKLSRAAQKFFDSKPRNLGSRKNKEDFIRFDFAEGLLNPNSKYSFLPDKNSVRLKEAISKFISLRSDNISVFSGADEIIEILPRLYLNFKDASLSVVPIFDRMINVNVKIGANAHVYPLNINNNFELTDKDVLNIADLVKSKKIKIIWLCSPNNPTGIPVALSKIQKISLLCPNSLLVVNEVYQEYYSLDPDASSISLILNCKNLITIRSFSKAFGLAGLRIGYAIASKEITKILNMYRTMFNTSVVAQEEALRVLTQDIKEIKKTIDITNFLRNKIQESISKLDNLEYIESITNFIFLRHNKKDLFYELYKQGILVSDWREAKGVEGMGFVRISVNTQEFNEILIKSLEKIN